MGLRGAIAAAVTPMRDGGRHLDDEAFAPLVRYFVAGGIDGLLACGTTGEGVLLSVDERRRVAESFLAARPDGFQVAVHAGAQTTSDTVVLAAHALDAGADAVAVIAPPYFPLDAEELTRPFRPGGGRMRPAAVLPLRVRRAERLRDPDRCDRTGARALAEPPRVEGVRHAVLGRRAVPGGRGHGRVHRQRTVGPGGDGAGAVGAVSGLASAFPAITAAPGARPERHARTTRSCGSGPACRASRPRGHEGALVAEGRADVGRCSGAVARPHGRRTIRGRWRSHVRSTLVRDGGTQAMRLHDGAD